MGLLVIIFKKDVIEIVFKWVGVYIIFIDNKMVYYKNVIKIEYSIDEKSINFVLILSYISFWECVNDVFIGEFEYWNLNI